MTGSPCPSCGAQVMSFGEFFRKAEPSMVLECRSCGARLARSPGVYVTLALLAVALMIFAFLATRNQPIGVVVAAGIVAVLAGTLAVKVVNYKLPLWRVVGQPRRAAR